MSAEAIYRKQDCDSELSLRFITVAYSECSLRGIVIWTQLLRMNSSIRCIGRDLRITTRWSWPRAQPSVLLLGVEPTRNIENVEFLENLHLFKCSANVNALYPRPISMAWRLPAWKSVDAFASKMCFWDTLLSRMIHQPKKVAIFSCDVLSINARLGTEYRADSDDIVWNWEFLNEFSVHGRVSDATWSLSTLRKSDYARRSSTTNISSV